MNSAGEGAGAESTSALRLQRLSRACRARLLHLGRAPAEADDLLGVDDTGAERLTVEAEATGCVQHSLGQTGADRGLR